MSLEILKHVYNACDPFEPATEEYYVDCAEARGSGALTQEFQRRLALENGELCFLFSGHIGCGKSSELADLRRDLESTTPKPGCKRYFTVFLNASDYLDDFDVDPIDILLAIVTEIAASLRSRAKVELKDPYFQRRLQEIKGFFLSDIEINEGELPLGEAKLKVQRLKKDPDARQKVRDSLIPRMSTMIEEINLVLDQARLEVKKIKVPAGDAPYTDLVLILDNLEKIQRVSDKKEGLESQRELFVERATQLSNLKAHVIYTLPLRLARADGPQLIQRYGSEPFVLPMVKIRERNRNSYRTGKEFIHALLKQRVAPYTPQEIFEDDALEFLVSNSGGHIRNLMIFVQNACTYTNTLPIPLDAAHRSIRQTVRTFATAIPERHWKKLAELDASTDQLIANEDPDYLEMLENLSVLEYINGDDQHDPYGSEAPWYAVNPIVRELPKFKSTAQTLSQPNP